MKFIFLVLLAFIVNGSDVFAKNESKGFPKEIEIYMSGISEKPLKLVTSKPDVKQFKNTDGACDTSDTYSQASYQYTGDFVVEVGDQRYGLKPESYMSLAFNNPDCKFESLEDVRFVSMLDLVQLKNPKFELSVYFFKAAFYNGDLRWVVDGSATLHFIDFRKGGIYDGNSEWHQFDGKIVSWW